MVLIESWLDAAVVAAEEAAPMLGFEPPERGTRGHAAAPEFFGAFVSIVGDFTSVQMGLLATREGHATLARTMLALMEEEHLGDSDMVDAVRELANVIAGGVKRRMITQDPGLRLGLPVFVHGAVEASPALEVRLQHFRVVGKPFALAIFQASARRAA